MLALLAEEFASRTFCAVVLEGKWGMTLVLLSPCPSPYMPVLLVFCVLPLYRPWCITHGWQRLCGESVRGYSCRRIGGDGGVCIPVSICAFPSPLFNSLMVSRVSLSFLSASLRSSTTSASVDIIRPSLGLSVGGSAPIIAICIIESSDTRS